MHMRLAEVAPIHSAKRAACARGISRITLHWNIQTQCSLSNIPTGICRE